jgi:hypothetical protein
VHRTGQRLQVCGQLPDRGPHRQQAALGSRPSLLRCGAFCSGCLQGPVEGGERHLGDASDRGRDDGLARPTAGENCRALPRLALGGSRMLDLLDPPGQRERPLLAGADREPGLDLAGPGGDDERTDALVLALVGNRVVGRGLCGPQPGFELGEPGQVALVCRGSLVDRTGMALGLARSRPRGRPQLPEPLGDRGEPRVGLMELADRGLHVVLRLVCRLGGSGEREAQPLCPVTKIRELLTCLTVRRPHLQQ